MHVQENFYMGLLPTAHLFSLKAAAFEHCYYYEYGIEA